MRTVKLDGLVLTHGFKGGDEPYWAKIEGDNVAGECRVTGKNLTKCIIAAFAKLVTNGKVKLSMTKLDGFNGSEGLSNFPDA